MTMSVFDAPSRMSSRRVVRVLPKTPARMVDGEIGRILANARHPDKVRCGIVPRADPEVDGGIQELRNLLSHEAIVSRAVPRLDP